LYVHKTDNENSDLCTRSAAGVLAEEALQLAGVGVAGEVVVEEAVDLLVIRELRCLLNQRLPARGSGSSEMFCILRRS
jgi:hypothetical protein